MTYTGTIRVARADSGETLGYVSKSSLNGAQLRYQDVSSALSVSFSLPEGVTSGSEFEITMLVCSR